uniref:Uncharacterized protein n=1 Tax=Salix viminalis TaxID=40686 RepID=A0A6N2KFF4_SALVM
MDACDEVKMMGYELGIGSTLIGALDLASMVVIAEERLKQEVSSTEHKINPQVEPGLFVRLLSLFVAKRTIWWIYTGLAGLFPNQSPQGSCTSLNLFGQL